MKLKQPPAGSAAPTQLGDAPALKPTAIVFAPAVLDKVRARAHPAPVAAPTPRAGSGGGVEALRARAPPPDLLSAMPAPLPRRGTHALTPPRARFVQIYAAIKRKVKASAVVEALFDSALASGLRRCGAPLRAVLRRRAAVPS